jgi:hypothetical protein
MGTKNQTHGQQTLKSGLLWQKERSTHELHATTALFRIGSDEPNSVDLPIPKR